MFKTRAERLFVDRVPGVFWLSRTNPPRMGQFCRWLATRTAHGGRAHRHRDLFPVLPPAAVVLVQIDQKMRGTGTR